MAKAQQFFGGTSRNNPSANDPTLNQVGHKTAGSFQTRGQADTKAYKPTSRPAYRPSIKGKLDNRKVGQ